MTESKTSIRTIERAATLIMELLDPLDEELAKETADLQYKCPRFHVVAGALARLIEEGRIADSLTCVRPHWISERLAPEPVECGFCGELFDQERTGQKFCSEKCGQAFNQLPDGLVKKKEEEDARTRSVAPDTAEPDEPEPVDDVDPEPESTDEIQEVLRQPTQQEPEEFVYGT